MVPTRHHAVDHASPPDQATVELDSEAQEEASERARYNGAAKVCKTKTPDPFYSTPFIVPLSCACFGASAGVFQKAEQAPRSGISAI
jgi:hypothetical protein